MIASGRIRRMTVTALDADGKPEGESKTLDCESRIRLHPKANPIAAYLSTFTLEFQ